jgi:hypothetical protein
LTMLTVVNIIGRLHIEGGISLDAQAFWEGPLLGQENVGMAPYWDSK